MFSRNEGEPRIQLEPPLPFHAAGWGHGFLSEASEHSLALRWAEGAAKCPPTEDLNVSVLGLNGRSHQLVVHPLGSTQGGKDSLQNVAVAPTAENKAAIQDLLGEVRKNQHINLCQNKDVEASDRYTGFEDLGFIPCALPNLAWSELDTSQHFLGRRFALPLLITGMTGGVERGEMINRRLAKAAAHFDIPMGIGSQRLALDNAEYIKIFDVKKHAPGIFLIANVGVAQLRAPHAITLCQRAVEMIGADALAIHINIVQELIQVEGDRDFRGLLDAIQNIARALTCPLIVKEVGNGIDPTTAKRLHEAGVAVIDVGGRGGTSWGYIEGLRSLAPPVRQAGEAFRNWGIPTAHALSAMRLALPTQTLVATGGIRNGTQVAKAMALGATMAGIGLPLMRAALESEDAPFSVLETLAHELRVCMMCTESKQLSELSRKLCLGQPYAVELETLIKKMQRSGSGNGI